MRFWFLGFTALFFTACTTTTGTVKNTPPVSEQPSAPIALPQLPQYPAPDPEPAPPAPPKDPLNAKAAFAALPFWSHADVRPALSAFSRTCGVWERKSPDAYLNPKRPELGTIKDWSKGCDAIKQAKTSESTARAFFETYFYPQDIRTSSADTGIITGYFQPNIPVRRRATAEFSEPILTLPRAEATRTLPRSKITARSSKVIAFGRPIDVFFMHVQGSGILTFADGTQVRAAYDGNNGHDYTSIGGVLISAGYMTAEQASKQSIETWMYQNGANAARMLMNENKRYIFFKPEKIEGKDGPAGAMGIPLTAMGSMAVDPAFHSYGVPIYVRTKLPLAPGDYRGADTAVLAIAQDTGKAIKGLLRGDIYFGSGDVAGGRAGVMKHPGRWTVLLPQSLARQNPTS